MSARADLERAIAAANEVVVRRRISRADVLRGVPLEIGAKWVLLARVDDGVVVNGYEAVRVADVVSSRSARQQEFTARAIQDNGGLLPPLGVPLARTRDLVDALTELFPLVGLHVERRDPDVLFIGRPVGWEDGHVLLHEIGPGARWERKRSTPWWPGDLTRLTVGDNYLEALALQAPERPTPKPVRWDRPRA